MKLEFKFVKLVMIISKPGIKVGNTAKSLGYWEECRKIITNFGAAKLTN